MMLIMKRIANPNPIIVYVQSKTSVQVIPWFCCKSCGFAIKYAINSGDNWVSDGVIGNSNLYNGATRAKIKENNK